MDCEAQLAFQIRVDPSKYTQGELIPGLTTPGDARFSNEDLAWSVDDMKAVFLTALMVNISEQKSQSTCNPGLDDCLPCIDNQLL